MHRSGTSLISKIIESQGVFMGHRKQKDNESVFFLDINEKIFRLINATWDTPDNFAYANTFFRNNIKKIILKELASKSNIRYFGLRKYLHNHNFDKLNYPWGWKDPRNIFTYDYWKQIFPGAKIIHIYRNPVDVANSMRIRQLNFIEKFETNETFRNYCLNINFLGTSYKCLDLTEGIKIWEKYIENAFEIQDNILHIKYEEFLMNSEKVSQILFNFIEVPLNNNKLHAITAKINKSRQFAFIGNKELENIYLSIKDNKWIKKLCYNNIQKTTSG